MQKEFIVLTVERNTKRKIFVDDILYCHANNTYTIVMMTTGESYVVSKLLKVLEESLVSYNFYRINRSCLVNLDYCLEIKSGVKPHVLLSNGDKFIPIKNRISEIEELAFGCR